MNFSFLRNKSNQENSNDGKASPLPPCRGSYVDPFLDGNGINIGLFKQRCPTPHGSGDSESNVILECKWEKSAKLKDIDTTLSLAPPGAESLASKGSNPAESMLKPNNYQPSLRYMGCIDCGYHLTPRVPIADLKCPICGKEWGFASHFLTSRENKRARKN